jgi:hypothetical protein
MDENPVHWPLDNCNYLENYEDFWVYGCPAEPLVGNPNAGGIGYWSPCSMKSCQLSFFSGSSIHPRTLKITGYVSGEASMRILSSKRVNLDSAESIDNVVVGEITAKKNKAEGWQEVEFDLEEFTANTVRTNQSFVKILKCCGFNANFGVLGCFYGADWSPERISIA